MIARAFFVFAAVMVTVATAPTASTAADFCNNPRDATERAICQNGFLIRLDDDLNAAYRQLIANFHGQALENARNEQRGWIASRNACGADAACIANAYEDRIAELGGGDGYSNENQYPNEATPTCPDGFEFVGDRCLRNEELSNENPCGPGFVPIPETDACVSQVVVDDNNRLPMTGRSYGGVVRSGPSMESPRLTSLSEGERIQVVENTGEEMNGYYWYRIRYNTNQFGYQWGGILCAVRPLTGAYKTCD